MVNLPEKYCENMKELLQEEYTDYIDSLSEKTYQAIRINTKKISLQQWERSILFGQVRSHGWKMDFILKMQWKMDRMNQVNRRVRYHPDILIIMPVYIIFRNRVR